MLARALYLEGRSSLNSAVFASITMNTPREVIRALVYAYLDWFEQHADLGQYVMQAADSEHLGAYIKVLRQKTLTMLPMESFPEQLLHWLAPYISAGSVISLPQSLYCPLIIGPSREFIRRWLRTRPAGEIQEAREPLAEAAWLVLAPPASQR